MLCAPERSAGVLYPELSNPMHEQKGMTQHIPTYPGISSRGQVRITQNKGGYPYLFRVIPSYPDLSRHGISQYNLGYVSGPDLILGYPRITFS